MRTTRGGQPFTSPRRLASCRASSVVLSQTSFGYKQIYEVATIKSKLTTSWGGGLGLFPFFGGILLQDALPLSWWLIDGGFLKPSTSSDMSEK